MKPASPAQSRATALFSRLRESNVIYVALGVILLVQLYVFQHPNLLSSPSTESTTSFSSIYKAREEDKDPSHSKATTGSSNASDDKYYVHHIELAHKHPIPTHAKTILDLKLEAKYNESCVELGSTHLEKLFAKPNACFSRKQVRQIITDAVFTVTSVFEANNITYFLDSGTLLGSYRHKGIVPFDQDADVAIDEEGFKKIRDTPILFPPQYYIQVWDSKVHPKGSRYKELPIRVIHRQSGLYSDVFVYFDSVDKEDGKKYTGPLPSGCWINCYKCPKLDEHGTKEFKLPYDWIYPLQDCDFAGKTLKCPAKPKEYLEHLFGPNFMEPLVYPY